MQAIEPGMLQRLLKALAVVLGLGALLIAPSIMPKRPPQYTWNFTNSVPKGVYKRLDEGAADLREFSTRIVYVTFCLPQDLKDASFFERYCSPEAPNKKRIIKRLIAEQTTGGLVVQGGTDTSLDSRILGPIPLSQVDADWRPLFTWANGKRARDIENFRELSAPHADAECDAIDLRCP